MICQTSPKCHTLAVFQPPLLCLNRRQCTGADNVINEGAAIDGAVTIHQNLVRCV